jgi:cytochrome c oxidase cbb3-type subunit III
MRRRISGAIALLSVVLAAVACGRPRGIEARPDEITDFTPLYGSNCAGCHGADGRHGVGQPLSDPTYLALVGEARLRDIIARGVPGAPMPAFGREAGGALTGEQITAIASGLTREWGSTAPAAGTLPAYSEADAASHGAAPGDRLRGRAVFATFCARCHGDEGRGGASAGSIVDRAYLALTSDQALRTAVIVGRADEGTPGWRDYAAGRVMSDQEISDVVAWVASHRGHHE